MRQNTINLVIVKHKAEKLPGDYIAGFVDGEGCFYLTYRSETKRKRPGNPIYYRWLPYFAMTMREDDVEILREIKNTLCCGNIYFLRNKAIRKGMQAYFGVQHIDDLYKKVMPFFKTYELRAKKRHDFDLWCKALDILYQNKKARQGCSPTDHKTLLNIREKMRTYKSYLGRGYKNQPLI